MQKFNAIKTEGRAKLAAMEKLANEIESVDLQMSKVDKRLWSRLAQQRDALLAQYAQAKADYVRPTADMDEFLSSLSAR